MTFISTPGELFDADRGDHGVVLINGISHRYVKCCVAGGNGWAKVAIVNSRGRPLRDKKGRLVTKVVRGVVAFDPRTGPAAMRRLEREADRLEALMYLREVEFEARRRRVAHPMCRCYWMPTEFRK